MLYVSCDSENLCTYFSLIFKVIFEWSCLFLMCCTVRRGDSSSTVRAGTVAERGWQAGSAWAGAGLDLSSPGEQGLCPAEAWAWAPKPKNFSAVVTKWPCVLLWASSSLWSIWKAWVRWALLRFKDVVFISYEVEFSSHKLLILFLGSLSVSVSQHCSYGSCCSKSSSSWNSDTQTGKV